MKAWLVVQEGPGAGQSYLLDPFKQSLLSIGRSSECTVTLNDTRASRHHADIRWNGHQWTVVDVGSTNGTYVNGMQVHGPYDLRLGDRVTVGETTLVVREFSSYLPALAVAVQPPASAQARSRPVRDSKRMADMHALQMLPPPVHKGYAEPLPRPAPQPPLARPLPYERAPARVMTAFWLMQGLVAASVICLARGAFLPWLRITGSLSQNLGAPIQDLARLIAPIVGSDLLQFTQEISGLEGYGKLTLAIALISLFALLVDLFLYRKSVVPALIYLLSCLVTIGAMATDLAAVYQLYRRTASLTLLLGIQLGEIVRGLDRLIDVQVAPLAGLNLTVVGLGLLLVGGAGRLAVTVLMRQK